MLIGTASHLCDEVKRCLAFLWWLKRVRGVIDDFFLIRETSVVFKVFKAKGSFKKKNEILCRS